MACVPHSASATTRACGNAARSPFITPGRPKNSSLAGVSATIETGPIDRHQPPPGQPAPRRVLARQRTRDPLEQPLHRLEHRDRSRACEIAALFANRRRRHRRARPTPTRQTSTPTRPHTNRRNATPSPSRSTPSTAPATTDDAARSARTRRPPHRPPPAGTPSPPHPTDTTSDNRRSDSGFTQPARGTHPNYTDVTLIERYCV